MSPDLHWRDSVPGWERRGHRSGVWRGVTVSPVVCFGLFNMESAALQAVRVCVGGGGRGGGASPGSQTRRKTTSDKFKVAARPPVSPNVAVLGGSDSGKTTSPGWAQYNPVGPTAYMWLRLKRGRVARGC